MAAPTEPPPSYSTTTPPTTTSPTKPPPLRPLLPLDLPVITALRGKRVILASASPRRKQLLSQIGLTNVEIIPSTVPENLSKSLSPFEYVLQTARKKCTTVYETEIDNEKVGEPALVIAADTVVVSPSGAILEKPRSGAEHMSMLKSLRDSGSHKVYTAVVTMAPLISARHPGFALESTVEETTVWFGQDITDEVILAYVKTREGADKAGGYGIQGVGSILVERIEGSFDNVVGLPVRATLKLIGEVLDHDEELDDEFAEGEDQEEEE